MAKWAKIRPEIRFFAIFWSLVYQVSFKLHRTRYHVTIYVTTSIGKTKKKKKLVPKWSFPAFSYFIKRGKILLNWYFISVDSIEFISVEWPWIKFKMRPVLFKKSWNIFYSNVVKHPVRLACLAWKNLQF